MCVNVRDLTVSDNEVDSTPSPRTFDFTVQVKEHCIEATLGF